MIRLWTDIARTITHIGVRATHEVTVENGLAHICGDDHVLDAVPAPYFLGNGALEVVDLEVLHECARSRRDLISALQTFNLKSLSLADIRAEQPVFM